MPHWFLTKSPMIEVLTSLLGVTLSIAVFTVLVEIFLNAPITEGLYDGIYECEILGHFRSSGVFIQCPYKKVRLHKPDGDLDSSTGSKNARLLLLVMCANRPILLFINWANFRQQTRKLVSLKRGGVIFYFIGKRPKKRARFNCGIFDTIVMRDH